jgi:hypothetical protein
LKSIILTNIFSLIQLLKSVDEENLTQNYLDFESSVLLEGDIRSVNQLHYNADIKKRRVSEFFYNLDDNSENNFHWNPEWRSENVSNDWRQQDVLIDPALDIFFEEICSSSPIKIDEPLPCKCLKITVKGAKRHNSIVCYSVGCSKSLSTKTYDDEYKSSHNGNAEARNEITVWLTPIKRPENEIEAKNFSLADLL